MLDILFLNAMDDLLHQGPDQCQQASKKSSTWPTVHYRMQSRWRDENHRTPSNKKNTFARTIMIRRTLYEATLVIAIALGLSLAAYVMRPKILPLFPPKAAAHPVTEDGQYYRLMSIDQAAALFTQKRALFADARPLGAYIEGHIKGAVHLDPHQFDKWSEALLAEYAPEQTIIAYCEGEQCSSSTDLAEKLTWLGFENVFYLKDGWGQWEKRQLPTVSGQ
jgi:rhodanese-related sulfurtransferase